MKLDGLLRPAFRREQTVVSESFQGREVPVGDILRSLETTDRIVDMIVRDVNDQPVPG